ncbi:MAG: helix-turn-helix domain-containing protein [Firmicutes bacterium]|nr:helix-turn-helix domain-containing protein [Bacillota bacterium]
MNQIKIGEFIAECRKAKNLTQQNLADKLNVTDRAISKWECGKGLPDSSLMLKLGATLDISVTELLCGEKVSPNQAIIKAEENSVKLLKRIESTRIYNQLEETEKKILENEYKETTSEKFWKKLNIITIFQSAFWIILFCVATFLNWHQIAVTALLVMMVLNATIPIIIATVRMCLFSMWLNLQKNIKD